MIECMVLLLGTPHPGVQALLLAFSSIGQSALVEGEKLVRAFVPSMPASTLRAKIQYFNIFFTDIDRVLQVS